MTLEAAIAVRLTSEIPGLHAFKDEIAWNTSGNPYPYLLITEISTSKRNLGTGIWDKDFPVDEGESFVRTKTIKEHVVLRITIRAVNEGSRNGNDIASEICRQIEDQLFTLCRCGSVNLPVPGQEDPLHIEQVILQGRADIAPNESGQPFIYHKALTYRFILHRHYEEEFSGKFEEIRVTNQRG